MTTMNSSRVTASKPETVEDANAYAREMNVMFATAVNIRNVAESLEYTAAEVERVAVNGVVQAARLSRRFGAALVVLTRHLHELPARIGAEVSKIKARCATLTVDTSFCTSNARLILQFSAALELMKAQGARIPPDQLKLVDMHRESNREASLKRLTQVATTLRAVRVHLDGIAAATRTARYVAHYIAVEAARLEQRKGSFRHLAKAIHRTTDEFEATIERIEEILLDGEVRLQTLTERTRTS